MVVMDWWKKTVRPAAVDMTIHPSDDMIDWNEPWDWQYKHYVSVGLEALRLIEGSVGEEWVPASILDMPCGYGRELRHLRAAYPDATIYACELEPAKIEFCAQQFGATPVLSSVDIDSVTFDRTFDLIWSGSLMTHLDEPRFRSMLALLSRNLSPGGHAFVTLHGRFATTFHRERTQLITEDRLSLIEADYARQGFGYADYSDGVPYGISLSSPSFVLGCVEGDRSLRVVGYIERGWDDFQDVLVVEKRSVDDLTVPPLLHL
jgi:SAM-dependent methyltransferase